MPCLCLLPQAPAAWPHALAPLPPRAHRRYANCALTFRIVDRVFEQAARPLRSGVPGRMGYEDFVWFILSEEDKGSETALGYWFRCIDLDCDGVLRPKELHYFYEEQMKRLEHMAQEAVTFEDVICQLHDMLQPAVEGCYTLQVSMP